MCKTPSTPSISTVCPSLESTQALTSSIDLFTYTKPALPRLLMSWSGLATNRQSFAHGFSSNNAAQVLPSLRSVRTKKPRLSMSSPRAPKWRARSVLP